VGRRPEHLHAGPLHARMSGGVPNVGRRPERALHGTCNRAIRPIKGNHRKRGAVLSAPFHGTCTRAIWPIKGNYRKRGAVLSVSFMIL
jgi:hypothetical protein